MRFLALVIPVLITLAHLPASEQLQSVFKSKYTFDERKKIASELLQLYPSRVPVIIEKEPSSQLNNLHKDLFIIVRELSVYNLLTYIIIQIGADQSKILYLQTGGVFLAASSDIGSVYDQYKEDDLILYLRYR